MDVLCLGYYDKFSRFFIGIKNELEKNNPDLHFHIASIYLSGFLYSYFRGISSSALSFKAWYLTFLHRKKYQKIISSGKYYKEFDLNKLVKLYATNNRKNYLLLSLAYIDILEKKLEKVDLLLLIGDLRLPVEIAKILAQRNNIPTYYIEQGPYHTTFFDKKGVNANASIRGFKIYNKEDLKEKEKFVASFMNRDKNEKYARSPFYRGIDYVVEFLFKHTFILPPDLKIDNPVLNFHSKKLRSKCIHSTDKKIEKYVFLLICQVPFDVNMTHHSPFYKNHFQLLKDVHINLPENCSLVVREHPVYKKKYGKEFYEYILENKNISLDIHTNFQEALQTSEVIIVNNSTVGIEAIAQGKTVITLANSYYDSSNICLKLEKKENLKLLLQESLSYKINNQNITNFLYEFFKNCLIKGFITNKNLQAAKKIAIKLTHGFTT
ncbi:capsular polysaccharide export protein, LipB/KpsS family [Mesonia maritima]|uniref:Capsular polysaccharide export protein n=1 Tax=Mesonia maritima TaxID=1793873 RepID=A0ABU1K9M5_9FLAO|nr:hypothetical protein [Mesonia maritima]MDR6301202.1 capsular polysaccharide export protein [Mesonia maritima]